MSETFKRVEIGDICHFLSRECPVIGKNDEYIIIEYPEEGWCIEDSDIERYGIHPSYENGWGWAISDREISRDNIYFTHRRSLEVVFEL